MTLLWTKNARDKTFTARGYDFSRWRYFTHTDGQDRAKDLQEKEAMALLLAYPPGAQLIFNHWRCSDLKELPTVRKPCFPEESPVQLIEEILSIFCSQMTIRALHEFLGFVLQLRSEFHTKMTFVEGKIVTSFCLGAYLALAVISFSDDDTERESGYRQRLYHDKFESLLSTTYNHLIGFIRTFVKVWCSEELSICFSSNSDA